MSVLQDTIVPIVEEQKIYLFWDGRNQDTELNVSLEFPNTSVKIYGLILGRNDAQGIIKINIEHKAKNTKSFVLLKGLLLDNVNVKFHGLVKLNKGAKQSDAWLSCYYLMLSEQAKGQAIPSLEIDENDIKAGHATTASRLRETDIFYLMTRGLSREEAERILIQGFIDDVVQYMPREMRLNIKSSYGY